MKGVYLGCCKARHGGFDLDYVDIDPRYAPDIVCDMLDFDFSAYDFVICTPPCNFWTRANPYWWHSVYAWSTARLLPLMLLRLSSFSRPWILENVINRKRFDSLGIYRLCKRFSIRFVEHGRHTYFTNTEFFPFCVPQHQDFVYGGKRINKDGYNGGGSNVAAVIDYWLGIYGKEH